MEVKKQRWVPNELIKSKGNSGQSRGDPLNGPILTCLEDLV